MTGDSPGNRPGLVARLIAFCADNPWITLLFVAAATIWGVLSLSEAPLDAVPDLSDAQVVVFTEWEGRGSDLVEDQVTFPISSALVGAPKVQSVRGQSMFGMSFVYVIFEDGTDIYWARSRVLEALATLGGALPEGVAPTLGPDATGVGWVYEYALVDDSGTHDLQELRSIQDWNLRYALRSVEGVAEVASVGGLVKEYQVQVDPNRLAGLGMSVGDVAMAVKASNLDVGGRVLELGGTEQVVRGRGYIRSPDDLRQVALRAEGGVPVRLGDVANVAIGSAQRRGVAELDGRGEVAGGIVVMRYGENALRVIDRVKERLAQVSLPEGVRVVPTYDRSELIRRSIATLQRTLVEEMIVVSLVIVLFLRHFRSALVPVLTLPVAVLLAFVPMKVQGLTANIMSLGGIAVAIGAMVDASIILVENVHRRLHAWEEAGRPGERRDVVVRAMQEVGPSIFASLLVITVSFLPVFTLQHAEGRLFRPLAFTKTWSMGFAALLAITATPALVGLLVRGKVHAESRVEHALSAIYAPIVRFVVRHRGVVIGTAAAIVVATIPVFASLGSEFMPPLNEGTLLYMPTAPPGMSVAEASRVLKLADAKIKEVPEVVSVFGKMGRAETATDPAPLGMAETTVVLKPREEWRPGLTWDGLLRELDAKVRIPGLPNLWWMPIQTRTEMLATGIRSPLGVQVFGDDLQTIEDAALAIERVVATVPGTRSAVADRSTGGFYLDVSVDRPAAARFGLQARDVLDVVSTAIGGMSVTETVEGRERYPVTVRVARELREDPDQIGRILVPTPAGALVPLSEVAKVEFATGPPMIRSEDGKLVGYVFVDPGERAVGEYVADAQEAVADQVKLPAGVRVEWVGQYTSLVRAKARLKYVVPLTLAIVALLLWFNTRSLVETAIVMLAVPFSLVGAVWLLWALGYPTSVAVWVGIIALAGLDAETGVVMLLYLTLAWDERRPRTWHDLEETIVAGAARRLRPKLMTVLTMLVGLTPVLWSTGTGADVMRRVAAPMVGGLATSFALELLVYPAIFAAWKGREVRVA